jgi:hypothetical protein
LSLKHCIGEKLGDIAAGLVYVMAVNSMEDAIEAGRYRFSFWHPIILYAITTYGM